MPSSFMIRYKPYNGYVSSFVQGNALCGHAINRVFFSHHNVGHRWPNRASAQTALNAIVKGDNDIERKDLEVWEFKGEKVE